MTTAHTACGQPVPERAFRDFVAAWPEIAYLKNDRLEHVFGNPRCLEAMGFTLEQFVGTRAQDMLPPEFAESAEAADAEILAGASRVDLPPTRVEIGGETRWVHDIKFPVLSEGGTLLVGGLGVDITERVNARHAAAESQAFERLVADIAARLTDADARTFRAESSRLLQSIGQFLRVERVFLVRFADGFRVGDVQGWETGGVGDIDVLAGVDLAGVSDWLIARLAAGEPVNSGAGLQRLPEAAHGLRSFLESIGVNSGLIVPVNVEGRCVGVLGLDTTIRPRDYSDDIVQRLLLVATMIGSTLRRIEAERALRERRRALRDLSRRLLVARDEERRGIARELHDDVTQRLAAPSIQAEVLETKIREAPPETMRQVRDLAQMAQKLATDVQQVSRRLHPSSLHDLGLVRTVRSECDAFSRREGIPVTFESREVPDGLPAETLLAVFRIVQESLHNVSKHARATEVGVNLRTIEGDLEVRVTDRGCGFDPEGDAGRGGIGLVSMQERAAAIGGEVHVESSQGEGTTVRLRLPLGDITVNRPRIVIADDHRIFAEGLRSLLADDYDVLDIVEDGAALLAALEATEPDLVVADVSMPGLSGIDCVRRLREAGRDTKIVLLTMHVEVEYAVTAMQEGASGYVLKAGGAAELKAALTEVLRGGVHISAAIASEVMTRLAAPPTTTGELTLRQRDVLSGLARGLTAKQIGAELHLSSRTVETHKYDAMKRLGVGTTAELIQYALQHGYGPA